MVRTHITYTEHINTRSIYQWVKEHKESTTNKTLTWWSTDAPPSSVIVTPVLASKT